MKLKGNQLLVLTLAGILMYSCQDDFEKEGFAPVQPQGDMIKLAKKLENPYSVANMSKAWDSIKTNPNGRISEEEIEIMATHLYVRFNPENESELDILKSDSTLILYDYPMDYEIGATGDYYRDPSVPFDQPTPQYCAVEADYPFSLPVEYEILEELFIPDDYSDEQEEETASGGRTTGPKAVGLSPETVDRLVYESMKLTGNLEDTTEPVEEEEQAQEGHERGRLCAFGLCKPPWRPAGRIMVWDNQVGQTTVTQITGYREVVVGYQDICYSGGGYDCIRREIVNRVPIYGTDTRDGSYVPLHDVEVRARRWFTTHTGRTNTSGRYSCNGTFKNPANYSIKWEKYHFSIRSGNFGQALHNGPQKTGDWDVNFGHQGSESVNDSQQYYALIFQGARDYYYGNRFGLSSPPQNGFLKPQIKIAARMESKRSHAAVYLRYGVGLIGPPLGYRLNQLPSIYIRKYNRSSDNVYAVTVHELAHWAHWKMDKAAFVKLASEAYNFNLINQWGPQNDFEAVIESWANGVEWQFAIERYQNRFGVSGYEYEDGNYQNKRIAPYHARDNDLIYTSIVVDMIDDCNQRDTECNRKYADSSNDHEFPQDRVEGYTIQQVEHGLRGARSWNGWRDRMKSINNPTSNRLNELFANWY